MTIAAPTAPLTYVGIDLGGTWLRVALSDGAGRCLRAAASQPTGIMDPMA